MANTDYEVRANGTITPSAMLATGINENTSEVNLAGYSSNNGLPPDVGAGMLMGGEIMRVVAVAMPLIGVARGCADTIPAKHAIGEKAWFFTMGGGADTREYMATETIGVKVLMKSSSKAMALKNAPPRRLVMNQRFARPYPPGNVKVNGVLFHLSNAVVAPLVLTWAHRDRITQGDTLQGHEQGNIGPEVGTTYTVKVYDAAGALKRTVAGLAGTTWTYSTANITADFSAAGGTGRVTLESVRDGYSSWQVYSIPFSAVISGWGTDWGNNWGGNA